LFDEVEKIAPGNAYDVIGLGPDFLATIYLHSVVNSSPNFTDVRLCPEGLLTLFQLKMAAQHAKEGLQAPDVIPKVVVANPPEPPPPTPIKTKK